MEQYEFRPIDDHSLADIDRLIFTVMGKRLGVDHYRRKYRTPRSGAACTGWLAYAKDSGQLAAMVTGLPLWGVLPDGRRVPIAQIEGTFTLAEHRGRGLMSRLVQLILEEHKRSGTRLFFGLPVRESLKSFVKLGFAHTGSLVGYSLEVSSFPLEAICRKLHLQGLYRWWANKALAPYLMPPEAALPNSVLAEGYGGVLHDADFFAYKTLSFNRRCRFAGIDSWLKFEHGLLVGDVALPANCPDETFDAWLASLRRLARRLGLRRILFHVHADSPLGVKLAARFPGHASWAVIGMAGDAEMAPFVDQMRYCQGDYDSF